MKRMDAGGAPLAMAAGLAAVVMLADAPALQAQCAMCRQALQSPEGQALTGALRSGILLLLAAPFTVFAVIATLAVRRFRRSDASS